MNINTYIDHTNLKVEANESDIKKLSIEAVKYGFRTVCVNPINVKTACSLLKGTKVGVACVVGFPLGENLTEIKTLEAKRAIDDGATELDMVICISRLKMGDYEYVYQDIKAITDLGVDVKVILETCKLTEMEIKKAVEISVKANAKFVKTSSGYNGDGATVEVVKLMKEVANGKTLVKASGGIKTKEDCAKMINAGADRIGTSSGIIIVS